MTGALLDTNVVASALDDSSDWNTWCSDAILAAMSRGPISINPIIYAELSVPFQHVEDLDAALAADIERRELPWAAAFLAGKAFQIYRRRGGTRTSPLPDFYIGAHAAVEGLDIVTRDPRRFTSYFPTVNVISPG